MQTKTDGKAEPFRTERGKAACVWFTVYSLPFRVHDSRFTISCCLLFTVYCLLF
jgi:hypothetical protein